MDALVLFDKGRAKTLVIKEDKNVRDNEFENSIHDVRLYLVPPCESYPHRVYVKMS